MDVRKWCPIWCRKFPSFCHQPDINFTFCKLCRSSKVAQAKTCLWAIGQDPPLSGWRVRRLMRHLASNEHKQAREAALEICRQATEFHKENKSVSQEDLIDLYGNPEDLIGSPEQNRKEPIPLTFPEVAKLLKVEVMMMKAYRCSTDATAKAKKRAYDEIDKWSGGPGLDRPSLVLQNRNSTANSGPVQRLEILYDDEKEFANGHPPLDEYLSEDENENEALRPAAKSPLRLPPLKLEPVWKENEPVETQEPPKEQTASSPPLTNGWGSEPIDLPLDALLCLPESLRLLGQSQTRIAHSLESLVAMQKQMLETMKDISTHLRKNGS